MVVSRQPWDMAFAISPVFLFSVRMEKLPGPEFVGLTVDVPTGRMYSNNPSATELISKDDATLGTFGGQFLLVFSWIGFTDYFMHLPIVLDQMTRATECKRGRM